MTSWPLAHTPALPAGWTARIPDAGDVAEIARMSEAHQRHVCGSATIDHESIAAEVVGSGSWTRRQLVACDSQGRMWAWALVHDRASGRTRVHLVVDPSCPDAEIVADALIAWQSQAATDVASARAVDRTQLDASIDRRDDVQRRRLQRAGYQKARTWLQMQRPVDADDRHAEPREGVTIRQVRIHDVDDDGPMPVAADLQAVHTMLERSFADHFNSYRESFPEFVQRLRETPGHRWNHWWLAFVPPDAESDDELPGGAVICSVLPTDEQGREGSYIDYIGVHRRARGRGVAKSLLSTVIADAAERGRNRIGLEVDADSPTGADGLYRSLGWQTLYVTESWQRYLDADGDRPPR